VRRNLRSVGIVYALAAATLFGASTPLAKQLLPSVEPVLMAGLLYLASGVGLAGYRLLRPGRRSIEPRLASTDLPWLAGAVACGGILGPVLLMIGLSRAPASTVSLLLTLETVFTALVARFVFRENFDRRIAAGMSLIVAGAVTLSWSGWQEQASPWALVAVVVACLAWATDNNLTRRVSAADPVQIAMWKGLGAGLANATLALWLVGSALPAPATMVAAAVVGLFGYGASLVFFILALRHLGSARTGAYFALAPFVGATLAIVGFGEPLTGNFAIAALLMASGLWLHVSERHEHAHLHEAIEHEHLHEHDLHHLHAHGPDDPPGEPHTHRHRHQAITHSHPHFPDIHHRHDH